MRNETALVIADDEEFRLSPDRPFIFGRSDADGVVGLDRNDMGISAVAGSIERISDVWWVVNRSRKRRLLLDNGTGGTPQRLDCGHRFAISVSPLTVLVPGAIYTHRLEVMVPCSDLARFESEAQSTGTITAADIRLSERDKDVLVALLSGYLQDFPRRHAHPRTYREAADVLGAPWNKVTVRKQVERLKARIARTGVFFEGPQANYDLADYLIENGFLCAADLHRLRPSS